MRDIKFRYRLKLVSNDWGDYKEGDIETFYISLNDKQNGLYRFSIDEEWDVVSCDEFTGLKDADGNDVYENDILTFDTYEWNRASFKPKSQWEYPNWVVSWNEKDAKWDLGGGTSSETPVYKKVIGNIYQKEWKEKLK